MDSQLNLSIGPVGTRDIELVPMESLRMIPTKREAIRQCIWRSGLDQGVVAKRLGIDPGHMSRIMSNSAHFPDDKYLDLYAVCGNYIPMQWEVMKIGLVLQRPDKKAEKIAELRRELNRLEATV